MLGSCDDSSTGPAANRAPSVVFVGPAAAAQFAGGDTLAITIAATDPDDGVLTGVSVTWWAVLHHGVHTHPFHPVVSGTTGKLGIPRTGHDEADIFVRLYARAADAAGVADTAMLDLLPQLTTLRLESTPSGLQIALDGQPRTTPYSESTVVGMQREIAPIDPQESGASAYSFLSWADGGAFARTLITAATPVTLAARFDAVGAANAAPTLALTSPLIGASVTVGSAVSLSATVNDPEGDAVVVTFFVDGDSVGARATVPYSIAWTAAPVGRRAIRLRARDARGAVREIEPRELLVLAPDGSDVLAPIVTVTSPLAGVRDLIGAVAVTATATDEVGVTQMQFAVDDSIFASATSAPWEATLPSTAAFASGQHDIAVRARDAAGNWSQWARHAVTFGGVVELGAGFSRAVFASGFTTVTTAMAFAPDGRLFVTEQGGKLRIVKNGVLLAQPFVTVPTIDDGERGLLGVAFDPDFAMTGWIYVYYTSTEGAPAHNRIVRYTASGDVALAGSAVLLAQLPGLGEVAKHNGGSMLFGPDGKLYVAVGDATTPTNAQSLENPFGKILRLNRNGTIPSDNPFLAQTTGVNRAIWARGLRNPFTMALQPGTGRLHINDVGQGTWEEVNVGRAGANYGWPLTEGPTGDAGIDALLFAFRHPGSAELMEGSAVIGGGFSPLGGSFGARFDGDYFFADYVFGWIYRLDAQAGWRASAFAQLHPSTDFDPALAVTGLRVGPDGAL